MTTRTSVRDIAVIPNRMEDTPEGFLICRDVPLARTGQQVYLAHEIPGVPARNGQVIAIRDEDEVFSPEAIESFRGKVFTDDHPDDDVVTTNFRSLIRGTVMNPRRGEGALADKLLGDIIVYDPATIAKIKAGKREVSNGYDADYEIIEPGIARQVNIRGNHVSLVDEGRCGPACAIRDKGKHMAAQKTSIFDHIRRAFRAKDEAEREEVLKAAEAEMPGDDKSHEGDGHHININLNGLPEKDKPDEKSRTESTVDEEGEPETAEKTDMDEDKVNALLDAKLTPITEGMASLKASIESLLPKVTETAEKVDDIVETMEDMSDPDDMATQDAIARAEIIAPGLTRPTTDAKPGSKPHRDAMAGFQRSALKQALTTDGGRHAVGSVLGHTSAHRITGMPANEAAVAFRAVSQIMLDQNVVRTVDTLQSATAGYIRDEKGGRRVFDNKTWNQQNAEYFKRRA